jgi:FkbM family methyltransferase
MLRTIASSLPTPVVRWLNQTHFRYPWTARLLRFLAGRVAHGEGVIRRGWGRGLRIDATGRNAGYVLGTSDRAEQEWLGQSLAPGGVFYDVGANVGFFTLVAARLVGRRGHVVAFEPLPENLAQLRRNIALNGFDHVTVVPAAAGSESGATQFGADSEVGRRHLSRILGPEERRGDPIEVAVVTIDEWREATGASPPSVMKIDVEAASSTSCRGAGRTIGEHRPTILMEVHGLGEPFVNYLEEHLLPLGYDAETVDGQPIPAGPGPLPCGPQTDWLLNASKPSTSGR